MKFLNALFAVVSLALLPAVASLFGGEMPVPSVATVAQDSS